MVRKAYFDKINQKKYLISFCKNIKRLFSENRKIRNKMALAKNEHIISEEHLVSEEFNNFFKNATIN